MNLDVELGPGFLLIRYPVLSKSPAGDLVHGMPTASTYSGPRASLEVKAATQACIAREEMVRVFALASLFELTQVQGVPVQKRIHDHFVGALDFIVREQMDGRGVQTTQRSPTAYKIKGLGAVDAVKDLARLGTSEVINGAKEWDMSERTVEAFEQRAAPPAPPPEPTTDTGDEQMSWLDKELSRGGVY